MSWRQCDKSISVKILAMHTPSSAWPASAWISVASLLVAACALWLSIESARTDREHKRLSVRPFVLIAPANISNTSVEFTLYNAGLGPAFIKRLSLVEKGVVVGQTPDQNWVVRRHRDGSLLISQGAITPKEPSANNIVKW